MKAVVIREFGEISNLKVEEIARPQPRPDEVLVEVRGASINPSDVKNVQGKMPGATLPRIPGRNFAGVVVGGSGDLAGREVWGTGGDIGFTRDGSHAQYVVLSREAVTLKPPAFSMEAAASAGLVFVTAWSALVTAAEVASGETVVIIGAAGGVGSAAVQIAKSRGARVIAVVRSDDEFSTARQNGANDAINSKSTNLVDAVHDMTANRGANLVFDTSGMMFAEAVELAAMDARIPVITAPPDGNATLNLRNLYHKTLHVLGVDTRALDAVASAKLLTQMASNFESGQFSVKPARSFPLTAALQAYELAAHGGGQIILKPDI